MLPLLLASAFAGAPATSWTATCTERDEPTIWWALTAKKPPDALPSFDCPNIFLDGVDCNSAIGFGRAYKTERTAVGRAVWELKYLPYGDWSVIGRFLDQASGGVVFVPKIPPTRPGDIAVPDTNADRLNESQLLGRYLVQREKSSATTTGITLHLWVCPDAEFVVPDSEVHDQGMTVAVHIGKYQLR